MVCLGRTVLERRCDDAVCVATVLVEAWICLVGSMFAPILLDDGHVKRLVHGALVGVMFTRSHGAGCGLGSFGNDALHGVGG